MIPLTIHPKNKDFSGVDAENVTARYFLLLQVLILNFFFLMGELLYRVEDSVFY